MKQNKNNLEYGEHHWSKKKDPRFALSIYKNRYQDVYNKLNVQKIVEYFSHDKPLRILDFGGGIGIVSLFLAKHGHKVTLADQSPEALEAAKLFFKEEGVEGLIDIVLCDNASNISSSQFDIIIAKDLIEHVIEDSQLIVDFSKNLVEGGKLILTTQNSFSPNYIIEGGIRRIMNPKVKWMGWDRTHIRFYNPKSLKQLLKSSSFTNIHFRSTYIFPYKLFDVLIQKFIPSHKTSFLWKLDKLLYKSGFFRKFGWNIMVIAEKQL